MPLFSSPKSQGMLITNASFKVSASIFFSTSATITSEFAIFCVGLEFANGSTDGVGLIYASDWRLGEETWLISVSGLITELYVRQKRRAKVKLEERILMVSINDVIIEMENKKNFWEQILNWGWFEQLG